MSLGIGQERSPYLACLLLQASRCLKRTDALIAISIVVSYVWVNRGQGKEHMNYYRAKGSNPYSSQQNKTKINKNMGISIAPYWAALGAESSVLPV
jgi:hypothetical protein